MLCPVCRALNDPTAETCFSCGRNLYLLAKGTVLANRYRIESRLGQGGMAIVYRAHDQALDEEVAVKLLRPEVASDPEMERRFRGEIRLARRVRHRNVCGIHEYGEDGHLRFIVMDFVDGVDLKRVLQQQGALAWEEAFAAAIQVAEGLQAVHEAGIVHRDLKTPNIMRDARGAVRLMDFGIAKSVEDHGASATMTGQIVGTPEYMSPEQVRGETLDARSDLYALGIVIYELFTADVPFRGQTPVATLFLQLEQPPPIATSGKRIPAPLVPVLERTLAKAREERPASAAELADELRRARDAALGPRAAPARRRPAFVPPAVGAPASAASATAEASWPATPTPLPAVATPVPSATRVPAPTHVPSPSLPARIGAPAASERSVRRLVIGAAAAGLLVTAAGVALVLQHGRGPAVATAPGSTLAPVTPPGGDTLGVQQPAVGRYATPSPSAPASRPSPLTARGPSDPTPAPRPVAAPIAPATSAPLPLLPLVPPSSTPTAAAPAPASTAAPAAATGRLLVLVDPWAAVTIDGASYGTTPLRPIALAPGRHSVVLEHPRYRPFQRKVTIAAGETTRLAVDLKTDAVPIPP